MNADSTGPMCNERFAELCALSTTGSLTESEWRQLESHIASCEECAARLADYESLASEGMAKVAAETTATGGLAVSEHPWARDEVRSRLLSRLACAESKPATATQHEDREEPRSPAPAVYSHSSTALLLRVAAVLVLGILAAYQVGVRIGVHRASGRDASQDAESPLRQQLVDLMRQRGALNSQLATNAKALNDMQGRATRAEQRLTQLKTLNASLEEETQQRVHENQQQGESLAAVSAERDVLQQKLQEAEHSLQTIRHEMNSLREGQQNALLRAASLETEIGKLSSRLQEQEATIQRQEQFLASDRDIRELMGARQLYIADVFDVDHDGKPRKPYGRVFYTKGKSLIFYAFDLDQQRGFREAKAFQAWGHPVAEQSPPVNLGIFYMDNEWNRRWVLKSGDPGTLAQIDAVFVTVEPKGGSRKPTGKPFLYAYLRTAPANHP